MTNVLVSFMYDTLTLVWKRKGGKEICSRENGKLNEISFCVHNKNILCMIQIGMNVSTFSNICCDIFLLFTTTKKTFLLPRSEDNFKEGTNINLR